MIQAQTLQQSTYLSHKKNGMRINSVVHILKSMHQLPNALATAKVCHQCFPGVRVTILQIAHGTQHAVVECLVRTVQRW
jgi:hypothetical protein